ncbi:heavy metal translocating P-type ATPase [Mesonia ostreae]|uniref:P-type Zn(2+) transporter n=3 Tax=Flavobacteriaceae TaxID=49546 RepID=A0A1N6QIW8_9FLAO|nr:MULTISPECIES: heavy metal translocating P-type ATPase [Flavobacteriaceae]HIC32943.1 cadmium-translocating P-type ATPase [Flavobacteriaceae bacterium]MBW4970817.1 cadmium-translocating P-type ATPase [Croceibacter atlanticus]MDN3491316.1 heavy metal translocating P-type ATPase [Winogradskyella bathintestinalis]MDT0293700.1 heavy metal translocating P-type ATPase [Mesonia ostreae]TXK71992.1 cadmium-translocating P-type ATPase [Mesonia sp. K4-1]|tara:strand:- start:815 stop:2773 length:1959 start_codon:yes stop_codon:yes gene_type:complete
MKKKKLNLRDLNKTSSDNHKRNDGHNHSSPESIGKFKIYVPAIFSFVMLIIGIAMDYFDVAFFKDWIRIVWYAVAYLPVGFPVIKEGWNSIKNGDFFTEFLLMSIATIGAFAIGEYPEGVAVMLFYAVGELFQSAAVKRAKRSIKALLDVRPNEALVYRNNNYVSVNPEIVAIGEKVQVRVGEKIPLDGILLSEKGSFNTAALTGESKPDTIAKGEKVFAGSINLDGVIEIETTKEFKDSSIARILDMVQNATARKSKTELFIRKFARIYTPIVVFLAIGLTFLPYFFVDDYVFNDWLYRALIFLVISCPCALVISIPLGYFGGLGAASKNGILFKGASFLDEMTRITTVVMDKTGTVTKGVFKIKEIKTIDWDEPEFMKYLMAMEEQSTHPIAKAIMEYKADGEDFQAKEVTEVAGKGLKGKVNGKTVLVGNKALMTSNNIEVPSETDNIVESIVMVSIDGKFAGYVIIADELKEDAHEAIKQIRESGISKIIMLSGDKDSITQQVAKEMGIDTAKGGLLPEDKLNEVEHLKKQFNTKVAFIGDGINDAPVLAASDVGIAMGGLGSDVAIETADVIIQTDQPSKIARAIKIGRSTRRIVWQNIGLAFGVKAVVLVLGAGGLATMWEAVFADVGVALLAILNAVRLQKMNWK